MRCDLTDQPPPKRLVCRSFLVAQLDVFVDRQVGVADEHHAAGSVLVRPGLAEDHRLAVASRGQRFPAVAAGLDRPRRVDLHVVDLFAFRQEGRQHAAHGLGLAHRRLGRKRRGRHAQAVFGQQGVGGPGLFGPAHRDQGPAGREQLAHRPALVSGKTLGRRDRDQQAGAPEALAPGPVEPERLVVEHKRQVAVARQGAQEVAQAERVPAIVAVGIQVRGVDKGHVVWFRHPAVRQHAPRPIGDQAAGPQTQRQHDRQHGQAARVGSPEQQRHKPQHAHRRGQLSP